MANPAKPRLSVFAHDLVPHSSRARRRQRDGTRVRRRSRTMRGTLPRWR